MIGSDELQTYYRLDVHNSPVTACKDPESVPPDVSYSVLDYFIIAVSMIHAFIFRENGEPRVVGRLRRAIGDKENLKRT
ncbi:hypothetical protein [Methanohalophilus sp.]|uniref:hypothetical protein n=1 Tax=Methanohalophilus sp. TaxID=1966352 RepID=UPI002616D236|nr:hypothetical protein [Methanohalophilus sp.]MDK2893191.1 hypothetical protein [Methanohalophilus sp.]